MNLTEYRLEDIKDQNLISGKVDVEYTWTKVNIRRLSFSISWSKRLCQKLKFQDQEDEEEIRTEENNLLTSPFYGSLEIGHKNVNYSTKYPFRTEF